MPIINAPEPGNDLKPDENTLENYFSYIYVHNYTHAFTVEPIRLPVSCPAVLITNA